MVFRSYSKHYLCLYWTVCDDCDKLYKDQCPEHGPLQWIKDSQLPKDTLYTTYTTRARLTLPPGLEILGPMSNDRDCGVFATKTIKKRVKFGPFRGKSIPAQNIMPDTNQHYMWDVSLHPIEF